MWSTPLAVLRGMPRGLGPTKACISRSKGLVPSRQGMTTEPEALSGLSSRKSARGVTHLFESRVFHFKDADLISGTVAVLHSPQDPESVRVVAFEIKDRVHEVLEHFGSCDGSVLGHVSDEKGEVCRFSWPS